jgi:hypothetical protein
MQPNIVERLIYTQILIKAGFSILALTEVQHHRGNGVALVGAFERNGKTFDRVSVEPHSATEITIAEQVHFVALREDGSFDFFVAHGDGD